MSKIASTLFDTGPRDELMVVDVYKDKGGSSNSSRSLDAGSSVDARKTTRLLAEVARDRKFNSERLGEAASAGLLGETAKLVAAQRLKEMSETPSEALDKLSPDEKDELLGLLALSAGQNPESVKVLIGGTEKVINLKNISDARSLTRYLQEITGDGELAQVLDVGAEAAVLDHFLKKAIDLGIDDAVDILFEKSSDKKAFTEVLSNNLLQMAIASDLDGLRKAVGHVGRHEALARYPRLIQYVLMFYRFPRDLRRAEYPQELQRLLDTLVAINPRWDEYQRESEWVKTLDPFTYASAQALALFRTHPSYLTQALVAPSYPSTPLHSLLRKAYPHIAL